MFDWIIDQESISDQQGPSLTPKERDSSSAPNRAFADLKMSAHRQDARHALRIVTDPQSPRQGYVGAGTHPGSLTW
jgi:hypothetical protein